MRCIREPTPLTEQTCSCVQVPRHADVHSHDAQSSKISYFYIQAVFISRSRDSPVGIEMAYSWTAEVSFSARSKNFSLLHNVQGPNQPPI